MVQVVNSNIQIEFQGSSPALPTIYWKINMQDYTTGPVVQFQVARYLSG